MRLFSVFLLLAFALTPALAADLSGRWTGILEMKAPDGNMDAQDMQSVFHQNGNELTGTIGSDSDGMVLDIRNGAVDGKNVSFEARMEDDTPIKVKLVWTSDNKLEGTIEFTGENGQSMTAKLTLDREIK